MLTILVVEDDPLIGQATQKWLKQQHHVSWVRTLSEAQSSLSVDDFDIVLLDLGLPDGNGISLIRFMKRTKLEAGIIIMTAYGEINDRIHGLDSGADDYLVKPLDFKELDARIRAVKRRKDGISNSIIEFDNIIVDIRKKSVEMNSQTVHLSNMEYSILAILVEARGRYFSKTMLEDRVYRESGLNTGNAIEVHISSIRKKLGKSFIKNTRGLGYIVEKYSSS